jgi:hypothetical protein
MFTLIIHTDNAAFHNDEGDDFNMRQELTRILDTVANRIDGGHTSGTCRDVNGNTVGKWSLDAPEQAGHQYQFDPQGENCQQCGLGLSQHP